MTDKNELLWRIEAHDAEAEAIKEAMKEAGLTREDVAKIKRARDKAAKAKATLDALMGAGLVPE